MKGEKHEFKFLQRRFFSILSSPPPLLNLPNVASSFKARDMYRYGVQRVFIIQGGA